MQIPLSRPHLTGHELRNVQQLLEGAHLAAGGAYTARAEARLRELTASPHTMLTSSCSSSLEIAACLLDLEPGDEIIVPSYTFVTTVSSFVRFGARPVFADIRADTCNIDERRVDALVTPRTRAIVAVHYAGVPAEIGALREIAERRGLWLIEDAAQALGSRYEGFPAGSLGRLAAISFHETKNFVSGEGGALCINDAGLVDRAHIIRDKGTNRREFILGQADKYTWVDIGASYVQSELLAAVLAAQLDAVETITARRKSVYERYVAGFADLETEGRLSLPRIPERCESNYHLFHFLVAEPELRPDLLGFLAERGIGATFHYIPLHSSPQGRRLVGDDVRLPTTDLVARSIVRLPLFPDLLPEQQDRVVDAVHEFFREH